MGFKNPNLVYRFFIKVIDKKMMFINSFLCFIFLQNWLFFNY